ncbi:hypothetical protein AHF37_05889 [Paragonimus kellicotti]|nr:hypothetical protein AHF37_05889 [Paragonimus kellicotti]
MLEVFPKSPSNSCLYTHGVTMVTGSTMTVRPGYTWDRVHSSVWHLSFFLCVSDSIERHCHGVSGCTTGHFKLDRVNTLQLLDQNVFLINSCLAWHCFVIHVLCEVQS